MTMEVILLIVALVAVVAMMIVSYSKRKKYNSSLTDMRDQIVLGDKVMTDSGIVGEVVDSYEEEGYKYFVLKSGRGQNVGFYTVHANAIYYVFGKDSVSQSQQTKVEEKAVEEKSTEEKVIEEKPQTEKKAKTKKKASK